MHKKALTLIQKFDTIIIHRHKNPDGDAIGSQVGLAETLKATFPEKHIFIAGDGAGRFAFMENSTPDNIPDETYDGALAIVLDCGASFLISDDRYKTAAATLRFDHHLKCEDICDVDIVDSSYESCCGLLADFLIKNKLTLTDLAAKSLFTGMVTDSGRFRFDSTTSNTFRLASLLTKYDFKPTDIYANLYCEELSAVQTRASFAMKIQLTPAHNAYIYNTAADVAALGMPATSVSRAYVGVMGDIKGVENWVNFTESDDGILCELRSRSFNINPIAVKYGGGGHAKASGCTVPDRETAMKLLSDLDELITNAR